MDITQAKEIIKKFYGSDGSVDVGYSHVGNAMYIAEVLTYHETQDEVAEFCQALEILLKHTVKN